jgi:hypothetical protein
MRLNQYTGNEKIHLVVPFRQKYRWIAVHSPPSFPRDVSGKSGLGISIGRLLRQAFYSSSWIFQ